MTTRRLVDALRGHGREGRRDFNTIGGGDGRGNRSPKGTAGDRSRSRTRSPAKKRHRKHLK
ncbi:unnamed protein product [Ectocarpus sp. 12 AP-2014]